VQSVRAPARLAPQAAALAAAALLAALAVFLFARPGDDRRADTPPTPASAAAAAISPGYNGTLAGAPLQRARCEHWLRAGPSQRLDAVRGLTSTVGGASSSGGVGTTLTDAQAIALFDRTCATRATRGFVLYIIYARAAAFSRVNVQPPADGGDL
jgi:hypothetical protein